MVVMVMDIRSSKSIQFFIGCVNDRRRRVEKHKLCCRRRGSQCGGVGGMKAYSQACVSCLFFSPFLYPTITMSAAVPVNIRRADADTPLPAEYSTTPHGTIYGSTPGGELYR